MEIRDRYNKAKELMRKYFDAENGQYAIETVRNLRLQARDEIKEIVNGNFSTLRAKEIIKIAGWVYHFEGMYSFGFLGRCKSIDQEGATEERNYDELRTHIKSMAQGEYLYLPEAVDVRREMFYCTTIWGLAVSPAPEEDIYVMDSCQEWYKLVPEEDDIVIDLLKKVRSIKKSLK